MKPVVGPRAESPTLVLVTTLLIVVTVGRVMDLFPPLYGVPVVKILTVVAVLVFALAPRVPRPAFGQSWIARLVLALLLLAVASLAFSAWRAMSVMVLTGSVAAIAAILVLVYKSGGTLAALERYLRALAVCAGTLTVGGLLFRGQGRLSWGRIYDPNDLAFVLVALLPIVLAFWRTARGAARLGWLAIAVGSVWVMLLTQSRGGLLGLLLVVSYLGAVGAWRARFGRGFSVGRVLVGWILMALLAVGTWAVLPGDARLRYETLLDPSSDYNVTAHREGRVSVWKRGLASLSARPWGVGIGAYPMAEMAQSGYWRTAHNSVLELSVELGVLGGALFIAMLARAWRVLGTVMRAGSDPEPRAGPAATRAGAPPERAPPVVPEQWQIHAQHLRATLIGIVGAGFFLSQAYALIVYAVIAVIAALEARYAPRTRPARIGAMAPAPPTGRATPARGWDAVPAPGGPRGRVP